MADLGLYFRQNLRPWVAFAVLATLFVVFIAMHPRGLSVFVMTTWSNQGVALAFAAVGQMVVVVTGGLDLSIGAIMAVTNSLASVVVNGSPLEVAFGVVLVILAGAACGLVNGLVVVYGRIQPIVATLASGAVFTGIALLIRPIPGGDIDEGLSDALTYEVFDTLPASLVFLLAVVVAIWWPYRRSIMGRAIYGIGSSADAAYMSGLNVGAAKISAYVLAGVFAAFGGLFLSLQTLSGDATIGFSYTLNSIAAVVIGGVALSGGSGLVFGAIVGAFVLRTISAMMFFSGLPPLAQPLIEGLVLLVAVSFGALRLIRTRNRLQILG